MTAILQDHAFIVYGPIGRETGRITHVLASIEQNGTHLFVCLHLLKGPCDLLQKEALPINVFACSPPEKLNINSLVISTKPGMWISPECAIRVEYSYSYIN